MKRSSLTLSLTFTAAVALGAAGCRGTEKTDGGPTGGNDLTMPACTGSNCNQGGNDDLTMTQGGNDDLAVTPTDGSMQTGADLTMPTMGGSKTICDITSGSVPDKTMVTISGVVVTGPANGEGHSKSGTMKCKYTAYVQDPTCQGDSGIILFVSGSPCTPTDGGACKCPYPPKSGTILDQVSNIGDVYTVTGAVSVYSPPSDAGLQPPQYEIDLGSGSSLNKTGTGGTITPVAISSAADIATFAKNGTGYQKYQSMLVTITPSAPAMASALDMYKGFTYGGAQFSGDYNFTYSMMNMYPGTTTWKSITGIAEPAFGGGVAPRQQSDFQQ